MKPYKWLFIFWMASTIYHVVADTEILLKEPPENGQLWNWHISPSSVSGGAGWIQPTPQKMSYSVCDIQSNAEPKNWLTTDFIPLNDAKLLDIKMGYSLRKCPVESTVKHCKTYLSLYVLHTNRKLTTNECDPGKPGNEHGRCQYEFIGTIVPKDVNKLKPGKSKEFTYHAKLVAKARGAYLMFFDQGVCIALKNFTIGYKYCSERGKDLVTFPRTVAPVNDSQLVEKDGKCSDSHSLNKDKLTGVCLSSGEWNITDGVKCLCMKGYELVGSEPNSLRCKECPKGSYKNKESNTDCVKCPANSTSDTARTGCNCDKGFYKLIAEAPCKTLPRAPLNANITVVKATYVTINWTRSPDDTGRNVLYYIDCFRCVSPKDKECKESCGPGVKYKPRKDNITDVMVTVNGLSSNSIFIFRVYCVSELNKQESDRDKWKYATVRVRTKEQVITPTKQGEQVITPTKQGEQVITPTKQGEQVITPTKQGGPLSKPLSKTIIAATAGGGGLLLVIVIVLLSLFIFRFRRRTQNRIVQRLKHSQNVQVSSPHETEILMDHILPETDIDGTRNNGALYMDIGDIPSFELEREDISFERLLGSGNFGEVYKAVIGNNSVAVKSLKENATPKDKADMITELTVLKSLNPHPHVVKLIGCCSLSDPLLIVLEYLPYGDLLGYLRKSRGHSDIFNSGEKKPTSRLSAKDLLSFAWMIADGMKYLAEMKIVHRDLAARNILVGENKVCKISDFGLARDVNADIYVRTSQARLPVKWMPPESIFRAECSTMSDVWSYGIVLWEVFTIGDSPYPRVKGMKVPALLERGYRMPRPIHISEELYAIMSECWSEKPEERPTFQWICAAVKRLINDQKSYINLDVYNDKDYVNFDMVEELQ